MCELCFATGRTEDIPIVAGFSCDDGTGPAADPLADGSGVSSAPLPVFSNDQIADQLTRETSSGAPISFDAGPGDTITVDITGLTSAGKFLATNALEAWENVTGLNFAFVSSGAQITFDDENSGAYASFSWWSNGDLISADVNVSKSWLNSYGTSINSYSFQTYIHEIGHALGLRHGGNYNGSATYGVDNHYQNDSWQATVMSYFSQTENTFINASYAYVITPMVADIIAVQDLYGVPTSIRTGATVYGNNSNAGGYLETFFDSNQTAAMTIYDNGGTDLFDFSHYGANQRIDLNQEAISNVGGLTGNLIVARGTIIENAYGGSGNDDLIGNSANNTLLGNSGDDDLIGGAGNDILRGGYGNDTMSGGAGNDTVYFTNGDKFWVNGTPQDVGGSGIDTLVMESGSVFNTSGLSWYGFEKFIGAGRNDRVAGNDDTVDYVLDGGGGNDTLIGSGGDDELIGGSGNDVLRGGWGSDIVSGGSGNDTIYYGSGDVFWDNGTPRDIGGSGRDKLIIEAGSKFNTSGLSWYGFEEFQGAEKNDRVVGNVAGVDYWMNGGGGNDFLKGNGGTDTLIGGSGNDTLDAGGSSGGWQKLEGEAGNDSYIVSSDGGFIDIVELVGKGIDTLLFKDLKVSDVEASTDSDSNMLLTWASGAGQVRINDLGTHIENFEFSNGTVLQADDFAFV
ncbi:M10 family metallopeptidase [Roseibium sp.]|uniref:M10 family metallopeptidase n=1 Tax=Roseibium sp. TaxID=1936156 RepID=UPI003BAA5566